LMQYLCDATFDRRVVRAVAGDKLLDNSPQGRGRQLRVGDVHGFSILRNTKSATVSQLHRATGEFLALPLPPRSIVHPLCQGQ
jgi:hypothetical protein